jgi:hypothetical protein
VLEDEVTDLPDQPAPVGRGHPAPRAVFEGPAGGANGAVDVFRVAFGHAGQGLAGGRVRRFERLTGRSVGPLPVDEQLAGGRNEVFDASVNGDSHEGVISFDLW